MKVLVTLLPSFFCLKCRLDIHHIFSSMIKTIISGFSLLVSLNAFSQEFEFKEPDNLKMKITTIDKYYSDPISLGDTIGVSEYDAWGNMIKTTHFSDKLIQSTSLYRYDRNSRLVEYIDIGRRKYNLKTDPKTGEKREFSTYDSTVTILIKKYIYENDLLKQLDWYEFGRDLIISEIYDYDHSNRIIKKLQISYPNPNTTVYFKPNSTEIAWDHPRKEHIVVNTKKCKYADNLRICEYFDSTKLVSTDTAIFENGLIQSMTIYRKSGEKIFEAFYDYDDQNNLIEYRKIDSGKSAFGGEYDMIASDKTVYSYDQSGNLLEEKNYIANDVSTKFHYYYLNQ